MTTEPLFLLLLAGAAVWVARAWTMDYRAALAGTPNASALPGAAPASVRAVAIASLGALVILAAETGGEYGLGLSAEQSKVTGLFGLYSILGAPVIEGYGMTEVHCYSTMNPLHGERRTGSVGLRLPYTEIRIADVAPDLLV